MNTAILEVLISVISSFLGVNLKDIKASLNKENLKTSEDNVISVSIDSVSKNLQDSKEIIENALLEIEKQKKLFEQMKQEAEISQQITTMNQEQVNALNTLLENTLNKQEYNIPTTVDTRISVVPTFRTPSPFVSLFINTPLSNTFFLDTLFQM